MTNNRKKWMQRGVLALLTGMAAAIVFFPLKSANSMSLPYSFTAGTAISASQVNANDGALRDEINTHEAATNPHHTTLAQVISQANTVGSGAINFNLSQGNSLRVENVTSDPACNSASYGRTIYNTSTGLFKICTTGNTFATTSGLSISVSSGLIGVLPIANGGTNLSQAGSSNQLITVHGSAAGLEYKTLSGTTNQITVTPGASVITLSLPQSISTGSSPQFSGLTIGNSTGAVSISSGVLSSASTLSTTLGGTGQNFSASGGLVHVSAGVMSASSVALASDVTGTLAFNSVAGQSVLAKTTTYPILAVDNVITYTTAGGAYTTTLPTAVGVPGKIYTLKKTDVSTNCLTVATTSSQTIDGIQPRLMCTLNESLKVISDGANWQVSEHKTATAWTSYTPASSQGIGTPTTVTLYWRRQGDSMEMKGLLTVGTCTTAQALVALPSGYTAGSSIASPQVVGWITTNNQASTEKNNTILTSPAGTSLSFGIVAASGANPLVGANADALWSAGRQLNFFIPSIPITNWWE